MKIKKATGILLVFVISWNVCQEAFFLFWYEVANASFTERFCVNVDQPELMCHGQCHIKKLAQEKQDSPAENTPVPVLRFNYLALLPARLLLQAVVYSVHSLYFPFLWADNLLPIRSLFHPPGTWARPSMA